MAALQTKLEDFLSGWFRQAASQVRDVYPRELTSDEIRTILIEKYNEIVIKISPMVDDAVRRLELIPDTNSVIKYVNTDTIINKQSSQEILKTLAIIESSLKNDKCLTGFKSDLKILSDSSGMLVVSHDIKNCNLTISPLINDLSAALFKLSFAQKSFIIKLCRNSSTEIANIISFWLRGISKSIMLPHHESRYYTLLIDTGTGEFLSTEYPKINLSGK
jgi:hypothetical protein